MDWLPTSKSAKEIAIEHGWTCRSQYDQTRATHHSQLHLIEHKMLVFGNIEYYIETFHCKHCGLRMDIVRPPKGSLRPEPDHAERCVRCNHLKHQHYHTVEGPDDKKVWVRLWCEYVGYEHDPDKRCTCKSYVAPKTGSGVSLLPSAEVEDVNRRA